MRTIDAKNLATTHFDDFTKPYEFHDLLTSKKTIVSSWADLCEVFVGWLVVHSYLRMNDLPILNYARRDKYFINQKSEHRHQHDGNWHRRGECWIDTKYNADNHRKNILEALRVLGVDRPGFQVSISA